MPRHQRKKTGKFPHAVTVNIDNDTWAALNQRAEEAKGLTRADVIRAALRVGVGLPNQTT